MSLVTLDTEYLIFVGAEGPIHPADNSSSWWTADSSSVITIDPGFTVRVRSVETRITGGLFAVPVNDLSNLGIQVQLCDDFDTDNRNYFSVTNCCSQTVELYSGDDLAYVFV